MGEKHKAEPSSNIENRLRFIRMAKGLSQAELAGMSGITRQAVCAIEGDQYLPTTAVALRLAGALGVTRRGPVQFDLGGRPCRGRPHWRF